MKYRINRLFTLFFFELLLGGLKLDFLLTPLATGVVFSGLFFTVPILGVIFTDFFNAGLADTSGVNIASLGVATPLGVATTPLGVKAGVFLTAEDPLGENFVFFVADFGVTANVNLFGLLFCFGEFLDTAAANILAADFGESFFI